MIPTRIKALFQFIDYLHSNIENFNQYNGLLKELKELGQKRSQLNKNESFKDKLEYDKIQNEISQKFDILKKNVINKIKTKANDLSLLDNNRNANELTLSYEDITTLKDKVKPEDLNEISEHKNKYLEYRKQTNKENYLSFGFLFADLDEYIVDLFSFFSEDKNEFDFLNIKIAPTKINSLSNNFEIKKRIYQKLDDVNFFQIYFETKDGKENNNNSILTPENWEQHKYTFFKQRMETHPESYTKAEKIKLELEDLEKLTINKTDYKILKERYRKYLNNQTDEVVQETPQQNEKEFLRNEITHPKRKEIAQAIKEKYSSYKNKDFKILFEALLKLDLFPKKGKRQAYFRCLKNEGFNISNYQILEDKHFKKGSVLKKNGKYLPSDDEIQRDKIIEYLETIIKAK